MKVSLSMQSIVQDDVCAWVSNESSCHKYSICAIIQNHPRMTVVPQSIHIVPWATKQTTGSTYVGTGKPAMLNYFKQSTVNETK